MGCKGAVGGDCRTHRASGGVKVGAKCKGEGVQANQRSAKGVRGEWEGMREDGREGQAIARP
eukprot:3719698-Rhodomonas_salina.3